MQGQQLNASFDQSPLGAGFNWLGVELFRLEKTFTSSRTFYASRINGPRKSSLSIWAGDHFMRLQRGISLLLAVLRSSWSLHVCGRGNPGSVPAA